MHFCNPAASTGDTLTDGGIGSSDRSRQEIVENTPGGSDLDCFHRPADNEHLAGTSRSDIQEPIFFGLQIRQFRGLVGRPIRVLAEQL